MRIKGFIQTFACASLLFFSGKLESFGQGTTTGGQDIKAITTAEYPTPARRPANSRLDCSRLEADFGLQMPDWQPYLERMLQLLALKQNGY